MTTGLPRVILTTVSLSAIPLIGIVIVGVFLGVKFSAMTNDVAAIANIHPLSGFLSSLGILLWWASATVWLFTASLMQKSRETSGLAVLVFSGLLSMYLAFDDLFQFHEHLAPVYFRVSEKAVYGLIAFVTTLYLYRYRRLLCREDAILLLLALLFLSGSVLCDTALKPWLRRFEDWSYLLEDALKWVGICFWTAFCLFRCSQVLRSVLPVAPRESGDQGRVSSEPLER